MVALFKGHLDPLSSLSSNKEEEKTSKRGFDPLRQNFIIRAYEVCYCVFSWSCSITFVSIYVYQNIYYSETPVLGIYLTSQFLPTQSVSTHVSHIKVQSLCWGRSTL